MKTNQFLTGAARSCRTLLCLLIPICITLSVSGQLNINPVKSKVSTLAKRVQQIYTSQIGIREKGTNSGAAVEKYLRYVDLPKGNPWCAAFVCWAFGEAGVSNPRSGWSPDLFRGDKVIWEREPRTNLPAGKAGNQEPRFPQNAKEDQGTSLPAGQVGSKEPRFPQNALDGYAGSEVRQPIHPGRHVPAVASAKAGPTTPSTGDIFGLFFPEKGRIAHAGFIDQWDGTWLITVEGNTNLSGSREGDGVYRKRRLVKTVYKVARYIE